MIVNDDAATGSLWPLVKGLDGTRTIAELAAQEGVRVEEVEDLVDHLREIDVVEDAAVSALDHYVDFHVPTLRTLPRERPDRLVILADPGAAQSVRDSLASSMPDLEITTITGDQAPLRRRLNDANDQWIFDSLLFEEVVSEFDDWTSSLVLYLDTNASPVARRNLNRIALSSGFPWISAVVDGPFLLVGPLFAPGETPCFECLEQRVLMNMSDPAGYLSYKNAMVEGRNLAAAWRPEPVMSNLLAAHAAMEVLNFLATGSSFVRGLMLSIYLPTMEFVFHDVLQIPQCPACGSVSVRDETEPYFDVKRILDTGELDYGDAGGSEPQPVGVAEEPEPVGAATSPVDLVRRIRKGSLQTDIRRERAATDRPRKPRAPPLRHGAPA